MLYVPNFRIRTQLGIEALARGEEIFFYLPGYRWEYQVSNYGRVWSVPRRVRKRCGTRPIGGHFMKELLLDKGYKSIKLGKGPLAGPTGVHRIVLETFAGPKPENLQCRHLDGNPGNNKMDNLVWGTAKENSQDRIRHGTQARGEDNGNAKLQDADISEIHQLYTSGLTFDEIGGRYGVSGEAVRFVITGQTFKHCQPETKAKPRPSGFQPRNRAKGKLTEEMRIQIRLAFEAGVSYNDIAIRFRVSYPTIWNFINGKSYC